MQIGNFQKLFDVPSEKTVGIWILTWGFLAVAMGSVSTGYFFLTSLIALIYFFKRQSDPALKILPKQRFDFVTFILVVCFVFSLLVAVTAFLGENLVSAIEFSGSYLHWIFVYFIIVYLVEVAPREYFIQKFVMGCRRGVIFAFIIGLIEHLMTGERASGFSGNPLVYAELCFVAGALSVLQFQADSKREKILSFVAVLAALGTNVLATSRGITILTLPVAIILATYFVIKYRLIFKTTIVAMLLLTVFAVVQYDVFQQRFQAERQQKILTDVQSIMHIKDPSMRMRYAMIVTGWEAFKQNPLIGVGIQNTVKAADEQSQRILGTAVQFGKTHLHNDYLNHLVAGGVGLGLLFVIILVSPVIMALQMKADQNRLENIFFAIILSSSFMGISMFNLVFRHDLTQTFFVSALIMLIATARQNSVELVPNQN